MKLHKYFQAFFFGILLINEIYFLFVKSYPYAIGILGIILLFIIVVEAFERGLSNIMFKTPQTQLDITMAEKELVQTSKKLASKITNKKKQPAVEETQEIIQDNLNLAFKKGLRVAGYRDGTSEINK